MQLYNTFKKQKLHLSFLYWRFVCNTNSPLCSCTYQLTLITICLFVSLFVKEIPYFGFPPDFAPNYDRPMMCLTFTWYFSSGVCKTSTFCYLVLRYCWKLNFLSCLKLTISRTTLTYFWNSDSDWKQTPRGKKWTNCHECIACQS